MTTTAATRPLPPDAPSATDLAETAETAVRAAGNIQRRIFGTGARGEVIHPRDVKMAVDRECESAIVKVIRDRYPGHRILAEEGGDWGGAGDYLWIIDPLDGTVNYFHGLPQFCACVACCHLPAGEPLPATETALLDCAHVGAVYAPVLNELYLGVAGAGATRNGEPITCGPDTQLSDVIVALSFGKTESGIFIMPTSRTSAPSAMSSSSFFGKPR